MSEEKNKFHLTDVLKKRFAGQQVHIDKLVDGMWLNVDRITMSSDPIKHAVHIKIWSGSEVWFTMLADFNILEYSNFEILGMNMKVQVTA